MRLHVAVASGAGATLALLDEGLRRARRGATVVIAAADCRDRAPLRARLTELEAMAPWLTSFEALPSPPAAVVLDDLASHATGTGASPHLTRWQLAQRLVRAGLDVIATIRVEEVESLSDLAAAITGRRPAGTVPDNVVRAADQLELVDITPEALRRRLAHGNLFGSGPVPADVAEYFQPARLARLREMAFEWMADRTEEAAVRFRDDPAVAFVPDEDTPSVAVALDGGPGTDAAVRRAARLAQRLGATLVAIPTDSPAPGTEPHRWLQEQRQLVLDLGGQVRSARHASRASGLMAAAIAARAGQIVVPARDRVPRRLVAAAASAGVDLHVVPIQPTGARRRLPRPLVVAGSALGAAAVVTAAFPLSHDDRFALWSLLAVSAAAAVSAVVGLRAQRAAARARADAAALARSARSIVSAREPIGVLLHNVRESLDVDGVAVIVPGADGPVVEAAAGSPVPVGAASAAADVDSRGRVLAVAGRHLDHNELDLLRGFAAQVAAARENAALHSEAAEAAARAEADSLRRAILRAVSHDLHTPLAAIKASVSSLRQPDVTFTASERDDLLATIETEADRLRRMVTNLLDVSRLDAGAVVVDARPCYLEDVVSATLASVAHRSDRIEVSVPETLPAALVDPVLLERALANLVSNALAWSPADVPVRIDAALVAGLLQVRVIDRGKGIPPSERDRVLRPFQRIGRKSLQAGAGLGLTVVSGFVDALGGQLRLDDTPGGGLTATICIAVAPEPSVSAAPPVLQPPQLPAPPEDRWHAS